MDTIPELCAWSLTEVAGLIKRSEVSPVELTRAVLERINRLDGKLHSYITVTSELALEQARAAEREIAGGRYRGPLHGIPLAVKDLIHIKGVPTTCGSQVLAGRAAEFDATVIEKLKGAGAILLGKLSMTEFAGIGYHPSVQPPVNPWHAERWPGGSSSGSGVATAARLCFGSLGSDTGGSIRFPAAACGIVGIKPTYGRVSRYGVFPLAESLDHVGPMARSVADAAAILGAIAGLDSRDPTTRREPVPDYLDGLREDAKDVRIGIDEDFCTIGIDEEVSEAVLAAAQRLGELGASIREVKLSRIDEAVAAWSVIFSAECAAAHEQLYAAHADRYGAGFRRLLEDSFKVSGRDYAKAYFARQAICRMIDDLFQEVDLLLCPTMGLSSIPLSEFPADGSISAQLAHALLRLTAPFSLTGSPTVSLPCGFSSDGLPFSLQLVARCGQEKTLIRAAFAYERASEWHKRRPPLD